jgi:hypothetical protein
MEELAGTASYKSGATAPSLLHDTDTIAANVNNNIINASVLHFIKSCYYSNSKGNTFFAKNTPFEKTFMNSHLFTALIQKK